MATSRIGDKVLQASLARHESMSLRIQINLIITVMMAFFTSALVGLQIENTRSSVREEVLGATTRRRVTSDPSTFARAATPGRICSATLDPSRGTIMRLNAPEACGFR